MVKPTSCFTPAHWSTLVELAGLLPGEAREVYPQLSERLKRVEEISANVGWGFHDYIGDVVWQLEGEFDDSELAPHRCNRH